MSPYLGQQPHTVYEDLWSIRTVITICVCGAGSRFLRNSNSAHYPRLRLDTFQGQNDEAKAQIFILRRPLLFFCQHFRKCALQAPVTVWGGSRRPLLAASLLKSPRVFQGLCFGLTFFMAVLKRIHHINPRAAQLFFHWNVIQPECIPKLLPSHSRVFQ